MISIIVAIAENGAIGKNNDLLWHLSDDLKRFKKITSGHTVIMGRKTFESLPNGALHNRRNIVLSRNRSLHFPNCEMIQSVEHLIDKFQKDNEEHFVIGGEHLYRAMLPFAHKIYLTRVHHSFEADVYFPEICSDEWLVGSKEYHEANEKNEFPFSFIDLVRIK